MGHATPGTTRTVARCKRRAGIHGVVWPRRSGPDPAPLGRIGPANDEHDEQPVPHESDSPEQSGIARRGDVVADSGSGNDHSYAFPEHLVPQPDSGGNCAIPSAVSTAGTASRDGKPAMGAAQ